MSDSIDEVRLELEETRERMSETVNELTDRITHPIDALRERLNPVPTIRAHPWIALGIAVAAGGMLGATGAEAKAAHATARAARNAGRAAKGGAITLADKVRHRGDGAEPDAMQESKPGALRRLGDLLADALEGPLHELLGEVRRASEDIASTSRPSAI